MAGLVPQTYISWNRNVNKGIENFKYQIGDEVSVLIKSIELDDSKMILSIRDALPDP